VDHPLTRAVMTVELVAATLEWTGPSTACRRWRPRATGDVVAALAGLDPDGTVVLVGHEPGISALGVRLTGDPEFAPLAKAQAVRIDGRVVRWRFAHDDVAPRAP
jgi:phosphohistidine phosphatase SixA